MINTLRGGAFSQKNQAVLFVPLVWFLQRLPGWEKLWMKDKELFFRRFGIRVGHLPAEEGMTAFPAESMASK